MVFQYQGPAQSLQFEEPKQVLAIKHPKPMELIKDRPKKRGRPKSTKDTQIGDFNTNQLSNAQLNHVPQTDSLQENQFQYNFSNAEWQNSSESQNQIQFGPDDFPNAQWQHVPQCDGMEDFEGHPLPPTPQSMNGENEEIFYETKECDNQEQIRVSENYSS